jgi:hypothetical protein
MAAQITSYAGLKAGVLAWLARTGDALLDGRFDDFLLNCERRMYYGHATEQPDHPLRSDPLRIPEMETVDEAFALGAATVAQPAGFLELISARLNSPPAPLQIVSQRILDGYGTQSLGATRLIAVSGTNFRLLDAPSAEGGGGATATLRYYRKLATPQGSAVNDILAGYPDVYLYGCLVEAAVFTQGEAEAQRYLQLYNASVAGLNARTQRITASAVPVIRLRAGMLP